MSTRNTRGTWAARDLPLAVWLALLVAAVAAHPLLPAPRWLMIHLLLLGAASHSIVVWSRFFTDAVLHQSPGPHDRFWQSCRLLFLNVGTALVATGVLTGHWQVVLVGATAVGLAVLWHGADLFLRLCRALPSRFSLTVRYYVAASCFLPLGAGLGTALARGFGDPVQEQVELAHAAGNLLGWMGLTIVGTLVTLWPAMLRTKVWPGAERAASRALPVLVTAVVVVVTGALAGSLVVATAGLVGYLAGMALVAVPFIGAAHGKPPRSFPTLSVLAAMCWWVGALTALAVGFGTAGSWSTAADRFGWFTPFLAAGLAAQVLLGALSYLVPVVLGNGPRSVRAANAVLDRGAALRVALVNASLLVGVFPVPAVVRVVCSGAVVVGLATFLPLLFLVLRASRRSRPAAELAPLPRAAQRSGLGVSGSTPPPAAAARPPR